MDAQLPPPRNGAREHELPRVDLSSVKPDYQSDMMNRDITTGAVNKDGITVGKLTETVVELVAPVIVGKVVRVADVPPSVIPKGKLVVETGRTITPAESVIANGLVREGRIVEAPLEASNKGIQNIRTPDFIVDGVRTELKTISNLTGKDISASLSRRILDGAGQGSHIILDVRAQAGMTKEIAERAIIRAFVKQTKDLNVRVTQVRAIGKDFDLTVQYNP